MTDIRDYLRALQTGRHFSQAHAAEVMQTILAPDLSEAQIAALLVGFAFKGETADEMTGFARVMREHAVPLRTRREGLLDTAGTGGGVTTFNISTTAAFVIAGAGVPVAKHGNTAITSRCGSADLLQALGVRIDADPAVAGRCLDEIGMTFLFAPRYHPAMKRVGAVRKQLGIRTAFNFLGPINNPAATTYQIIGVYDERFMPLLAEVLRNLGTRRAWVFHSTDGMDEISAGAPTRVVEVVDGAVSTFQVTPESFGLAAVDGYHEMAGGDREYNARLALGVLTGEVRSAARSVVLINAAAGLFVAGRAPSLRAAMVMAEHSVDSGAARRKLEALAAMTNACGQEAVK